jgi:hypothetical protein
MKFYENLSSESRESFHADSHDTQLLNLESLFTILRMDLKGDRWLQFYSVTYWVE